MAVRRGREDSKTRSQLIDEALKLIFEEGIGALTARRLAQRAGLGFQLVHYYFKSMDDLLISVIEQSMAAALAALDNAARSDNPLSALIDFHRGPQTAILSLEFEIHARSRPAIHEAIRTQIDRFKTAQAELMLSHLKLHNLDKHLPPLAMTIVLTSAFRVLALEGSLGAIEGHEETLKWLGALLDHPSTFDISLVETKQNQAVIGENKLTLISK